ncbi:MAG: M48 family metallopeptidase [Candidatus Caldarchaeum sp.]
MPRYRIIYRPVKHPRIELKTGNPTIILPYGKDPREIVTRHRKWIEQKLNQIEQLKQHAKHLNTYDRKEEEFKVLLLEATNKQGEPLNIHVNNIYIRRMKTKWASLSKRHNLTINRLVSKLPDELIDYIIYHELMHVKQRRHNSNFWALIEEKYPNYQELEQKLAAYWFLLINNRRTKQHAVGKVKK